VLSVVQMVLMTAMVGVLFVELRPMENNAARLGRRLHRRAGPAQRGRRRTVVHCRGAATLVSVRWGVKGHGLICIAVLVIALIAARALATQSKVPVPEEVTR
jgi:hypothetical protein